MTVFGVTISGVTVFGVTISGVTIFGVTISGVTIFGVTIFEITKGNCFGRIEFYRDFFCILFVCWTLSGGVLQKKSLYFSISVPPILFLGYPQLFFPGKSPKKYLWDILQNS